MIHFQKFRSIAEAAAGDKRRRWLLVGAVLLLTHALSALYYGARYANHQVTVGSAALSLEMTPEDWAAPLGDMDSAWYLRTAVNYAAGRGVTVRLTESSTTQDLPFFYWAPGTPVTFGTWMKLFGRDSMWPIFWFAVAAQLLFGVISLATASLWTRNMLALAAVAFCTGFCPPLQQWFYGTSMVSSELVALVPLSAIMFVLAKGFIAFRAAEGSFWTVALNWRVAVWFAAAGLLIGVNSLVRDSCEVLATFVALFIVFRSLVFDRRRLALAACTAAILLLCIGFVRYPVKRWNRHRIGIPAVSTGVRYGVWCLSMWSKHDRYDWYVIAGIGCGEYLDPEAAKRVEAYFQDKKPHAELYSLGQFAQAVWKRPLDAIAFKAERLPVLWLGASDLWPKMCWTLVSIWCAAFYASLAAFCGIQWWRRRRIPEVMYLCLTMMICASAIVHFELRYTFPVWTTLVMAPGLVVAALARNGWSSPPANRSIDEPANAALAPTPPALAA